MKIFKQKGDRSKKNFWATNSFLALLGIVLVSLSVFLWKRQEAKNLSQIESGTKAEARFYASETEIRFTSIYEALGRLASRGEPRGEIDVQEWEKDASFYIDAFAGIESIAWVDETFHIRQIVPTQANSSSIGKPASQFQGSPSDLNLWVPIYISQAFKGYILGVVKIDSFISPVIREIESDYMIQLSEEGQTIFESETWQQPEERFVVRTTIPLENTTVLNLAFAPTQKHLRTGVLDARTTLFFGLLFSLIALVAVYFAQNYNAIAVLNEMRYRNLFNASRDAIFIINMEGAYQDANPAAITMIGYSLAEIRQKTVDDLRAQSDPLPEEARSRLWTSGGALELSLRHKDGHTIPVDLMISPIMKGVEQQYVLGIARDISERIQAEQELEKYHNHLEKLVEQRTSQLEKINQELEDFAYIVSHDLKAPLRGIIQLAGWIAHDYADVLDEQGHEMLQMLTNRTMRMHDLILGILQYSRIGRVKEKTKQIDLHDLVVEVIDALRPPPHIRIKVEDKLPTLHAERTRLYQVFQNLIGNAVKYMDKPDGRIGVGCLDQGDAWQFHVRDNGPGIEERYFEKIFQMFQTLSPRDQVEGAGVGLALVKKIVDDWGGEVWLESQPGEGSVFFFTFPKSVDEKGAEK